MQESLFYQEILEKGEQRGLQQGLRLGIEQGQKQQALLQTLRLLRRRVGKIAPNTEEIIRALSISHLENLAEALLDFSSPADLTAWMDRAEFLNYWSTRGIYLEGNQ